MPTLRDRIDLATVTATFLPLPKGKKRGTAVGFCAGEPVVSVEGAGQTALPFRWVNGKAESITFPDVKKFRANATSESQIAGAWITSKDDERAVVWTRNAEGAFVVVRIPGDARRSGRLHRSVHCRRCHGPSSCALSLGQ